MRSLTGNYTPGDHKAVHRWRATTLTSLSARPAFKHKCTADVEEVTNTIIRILSYLLPPPPQYTTLALESLRSLVQAAAQLSIEMRTQSAEYIMKRAPRPEYDDIGEVTNTVPFSASAMQNRGSEPASEQELEAEGATVMLVLFPQVIRRGNERGENYGTVITVLPMQVLVNRPQLRSESRVSNRSTDSVRQGGQKLQRLTPTTDQTLPTVPEQD